MRHFNVKNRKFKEYLKTLTDKVLKDNVKISEHCYRNMPHLILDIHDCSTSINKKTLLEFLFESPKKIGMQICASPLVSKNHWIIPLKESHISVHYSNEILYVDVFSCRPFDIEAITNYTLEYFTPQTFEIELLYRGAREIGTL